MHGDYFPGNVLLGDDLRVSAVLDLGWLTVVGDPTHDVRSAVCFWAVRPWSRPGDDDALLAAAQRHLGPEAAGLIERTRRFEQLRFAFVAEDPHLHAWCLAGLRRAAQDYGTRTTLPPTLRSCRSVSARTTSSSGYSVGSTGWRRRRRPAP